MQKLSETLANIISDLDNYDIKREKVIILARKLNRISGRSIGQLINGKNMNKNLENARSIMKNIKQEIEHIIGLTSWKIIQSEVEEYCEFEIMNAIVNNYEIPLPDKLLAPSWIWISALGDVMGELRRLILNRIINNNIAEGRDFLKKMQIIFDEIYGLDFSKSMIPNFRRKIDTARVTIERTESDMANALVSLNLREGIKEIKDGLNEN